MLRVAPALQTRRAGGVENGYCLNIHLIWAAPAVSTVDIWGKSQQRYHLCVCVFTKNSQTVARAFVYLNWKEKQIFVLYRPLSGSVLRLLFPLLSDSLHFAVNMLLLSAATAHWNVLTPESLWCLNKVCTTAACERTKLSNEKLGRVQRFSSNEKKSNQPSGEWRRRCARGTLMEMEILLNLQSVIFGLHLNAFLGCAFSMCVIVG